MTDRRERVRQAIGRRVPRVEASGKMLDLIVEDVLAALDDDLLPEMPEKGQWEYLYIEPNDDQSYYAKIVRPGDVTVKLYSGRGNGPSIPAAIRDALGTS